MKEVPRFSVEEVEAVYAALKSRFRKMGHGSVKAAEKALGLGRAYFSSNRLRKRLDFGTLLAALEFLEVDPGEFFAEVFGGGRISPDEENSDGTEGASGSQKRVKGENEATVRRATGLSSADSTLRAELLEWLKRMDAARYSDPETTIVELWGRVKGIPTELSARYLAVLGSSYRMIGNLSYAQECLEMGMGRSGGQDEVTGDLLQRLSYVIFYRGDAEEALYLAERAAGLYLRIADERRLGQSLVDQAKFLIHLSRLGAARKALVVAKHKIRTDDQRNLFAIENFLSDICRREGAIESCLSHIRTSLKIAPDSLAKTMALYELGDVHRDLGRFSEAATAYEGVIESLSDRPLTALLASVRLVDVLARQGNIAEALSRALLAKSYFGSLKGDRLAEAAIVELDRQACQGVLRPSAVARAFNATKQVAFSPQADNLAARLKRIRRLRGISSAHAALEIGIPPESFRKIENGSMPGTLHMSKLTSWLKRSRPELDAFGS